MCQTLVHNHLKLASHQTCSCMCLSSLQPPYLFKAAHIPHSPKLISPTLRNAFFNLLHVSWKLAWPGSHMNSATSIDPQACPQNWASSWKSHIGITLPNALGTFGQMPMSWSKRQLKPTVLLHQGSKVDGRVRRGQWKRTKMMMGMERVWYSNMWMDLGHERI